MVNVDISDYKKGEMQLVNLAERPIESPLPNTSPQRSLPTSHGTGVLRCECKRSANIRNRAKNKMIRRRFAS
ncbi:hypothetical protein Y032_0043g833 [Ancylostoma ceylanicum]|uniref:Uncharacterized protein n=1 Tax=Ancylostoma ceylanicum TaxID=53326 RepID=A0A016UEA9_9BILA|nr:hypothetical protein Y032_0043g833 [Ancylostoma ceylanicum]